MENRLTIGEVEPVEWGEIVEIRSQNPGRYDVSLIYNCKDLENRHTLSEFKYATICPYFDIIANQLSELGNLVKQFEQNPFDKETLEKINSLGLLKNPPFKRRVKLNFTESSLTDKIIWFCCEDIPMKSKVALAVIDFDLENGGNWTVEESESDSEL